MTSLRIVTTKAELRAEIAEARNTGASVGFVPTMGALHEGHLSLMREAKSSNDIVVVSVFVNPTQFGPDEDFDQYPRTLEQDVAVCQKEGVDIVFAPSAQEMYGLDAQKLVGGLKGRTAITAGSAANQWEGEHRPGHFDGVVLVVLKLLNCVTPDRVYFGEKDYQQVAVVSQMVADLDVPVKVVACPIVRDADGLALSSRNRYLSSEQRAVALEIPRAIQQAQEFVVKNPGTDAAQVEKLVVDHLQAHSNGLLEIGYVAVVDADTLDRISSVAGRNRLLISVWVGDTHLIDNATLST